MLNGNVHSWWSVLCLAIVIIASVIQVESAQSISSKLVQKLVSNYGPTSVRPVNDESTVTVVILRLLITQIIAMNERDQTVVISGWMKWNWYDENMKWNAGKNRGINKLFVATDKIWMPDITLYTNVDVGYERYKELTATVYSNGEVIWAAPAILTFTCRIDATLFPFDSQICGITFGSFTHHSEEIELLQSNGTDSLQNQFAQNGVWQLTKVKVRHNRQEYIFGCCPKPVSELTYSLFLERRPLFHVLNIIIPCVLLTILNLTVFILPPEAGEKIGLGMTNLLALVLFQQLVNASIPPSSDNSPIISYYFTPMIFIGCISIINAVVVLKLFYYGRHCTPVPPLMKTAVLQCLAVAVFYTKIPYADELKEGTTKAKKTQGLKLQGEGNVEGDVEKNLANDKHAILTDLGRNGKEELLETDIEKEKNHCKIDWQNVALVWDKFMLILTIVLTFVAMSVTLFLYVVKIHARDVELDEEQGKIVTEV